jgi:DNA-binding NarL/FixJ family response regulator
MHSNFEIIPQKRKVFILDDHPIVREGLTLLINLEPDLLVCGQAAEMGPALQLVDQLKPDILIVDISLRGPDGLAFLSTLRAADARIPVLVLSMLDEELYAERALRAGANGYMMKQEATGLVLDALRHLLKGEVWVSHRVSAKMLKQLAAGVANPQRSIHDELSNRELEVLRLMGLGFGTRQIAEELGLSIKTIETYQSHLKEKLGLRNSRELVQSAIEWTLRNQSPPQ